MATEVKIKEIFESIQGEGPFVGVEQLFIRFCGCNKKIRNEYDLNKVHSVSLTGGEPLLHADFINEFIPLLFDTKIYLETNATLSEELLKVKDKIDIISADIKIPSSTGKNTFALHNEFLSNCDGIFTFAKIVFDQNITNDEIETCTNIGKKYGIELILQPKMSGNKMSIDNDFCQNIFDKFLKLYPNIRLIPQVHKFLDVK